MQCPKCRATMRTYDRSGVHIEQCDGCRGIFLDYGELEALAKLETRYSQPAPPPPPPPGGGYAQPVQPAYGAPAPAWGAQQHGYGHGHKKQKGWAHALFSS